MSENGKKERKARMSEGIVRAVFFCVSSVFSCIKKKKLTRSKNVLRRRGGRGVIYHAENPRKKMCNM